MLCPVDSVENMAIKRRTEGLRLNSPGDGMATLFLKGILVNFLVGRGGRIEVAICNRAGELDRTARSPTSRTPQSLSICGGGGWNDQGMMW